MSDAKTAAENLGRVCAEKGLRLRDAKYLFDALYVSDALMLSGGNITKAAERAGIRRENLTRLKDRREIQLEKSDV